MKLAMENAFKHLRIKNTFARELLAEFLGTFVLVMFGTGSIAQFILSEGSHGSLLTVALSWGFGVTMGLYAAGGVSGHLNPAVTLAMFSCGKIIWWKVVPYMLVQYFGAFVAAACTCAVYIGAIQKRGFDVPGTAGIFVTFPEEFVTHANAFLDHVAGTALLLLLVMAITDPRNMEVSKGLIPLSVGFIVTVIVMAFGFNCGCPLNPARDLGPRIFTSIAGWGTDVFTYRSNYWWIPVVGPHVGAIVGVWTYLFIVGFHWEPLPEVEKPIKLETRF